jgi:hypothetical protein
MTTHLQRKQLSPLTNIFPQGLPSTTGSEPPAPENPSSACTSLRVACSGRPEFEFGRNKWEYGPQNASYSSDSISARVAGVNTYFLGSGIVSRAKRSLVWGSAVRSRGFIDGRNFDGKNEKLDMSTCSGEPFGYVGFAVGRSDYAGDTEIGGDRLLLVSE